MVGSWLFFNPFSYSMSLIGEFNPFAFQVIIDRQDFAAATM